MKIKVVGLLLSDTHLHNNNCDKEVPENAAFGRYGNFHIRLKNYFQSFYGEAELKLTSLESQQLL